MEVILFFSRRYLLEKKRATISALLAISLGVAILVAFLSLTNGYRHSLVDRILGVSGHIRVMNYQGSPLHNYKDKIEEISAIEGVSSARPLILKNGFIDKYSQMHPVQILGIPSLGEAENLEFTAGSSTALEKGKSLLGTELAKKTGTQIGDKISFLFPDGQQTKLETGAIFDAALRDYNSRVVYISFSRAQEIFDMEQMASMIRVNTEDPFQAKETAQKIEEQTGRAAVTWQEENENLFSAMKVEERLFAIILFFMLVIAGFGTANLLNMLVMEKESDIGILKAMGAPAGKIRYIFLCQGLLLGAGGTFLGMGLGIIITIVLSHYPINVPGDVYNVEYLEIQFRAGQLLLVGLITILITSLAALFPSHRATKLEAVEVLRNE
ncbi:MAG: ABC transporter permease [Halanaerobiales bacterium]